MPAEAFTDVLPLLRRTFAAYEPGVRRTLGELVRRGPGTRPGGPARGAAIPGFAAEPDAGRADAVLPVLRLLLGPDADHGAPYGTPYDTPDGAAHDANRHAAHHPAHRTAPGPPDGTARGTAHGTAHETTRGTTQGDYLTGVGT